MAQLMTPLFQSQTIANGSNTTLLTVPSNPSNSYLRNGLAQFNNDTNAPVQLQVWATPSGGSAITLFGPANVNADSSVVVNLPQLNAGGTITATAGAAASIRAHSLDGFYQS